MKNLFLAVSVFLASLAYGQDSSVKKLMKLAEKGDVKAQSELAEAYLKGKGVKRSFQDAALWLEKVAETGDAQAQYQLAHLHLDGKGMPKSEEKGAEWLAKAAENGNQKAEQELALCYRDGRGVPQSTEKYYAWIEKNADNEKAETLLDLAKAYYAGDGVTKDVNKAKFWADKAAKKGNKDAELLLATWVYEINPSNPEAIQRLMQVAEKGDTEAQAMIGESYLNGKGVEQSESKAIEWFEKAAAKGNATALYHLANFYFYGNSPLIGKFPKKALDYYTQAANKGNVDAQRQLAVCLYNGIGGAASQRDAFNWILKAVNANPSPITENNLAVCYATGNGTRQSVAQAVELFRKAADAGDVTAQYNLGTLLLEEPQQDVKKAFEYLEKAAAQNHLLALKKLGDLNFTGKYTNQSYARAFEYYNKAAKLTPTPENQMLDYFYQGQADAYADVLFTLSQCYADGKGVKKSPREAAKWAMKAADLSHKGAFDWLLKKVEANDLKETPEVILTVADGYFYGKGVKKQNDKAFALYEKLAKQQDNTQAQKRLIEYYFEAKNPQKDEEKAVYWSERVAKKGDAETQYNLGKHYMTLVPDVAPAPKEKPAPAPKTPAPAKGKTTTVTTAAATATPTTRTRVRPSARPTITENTPAKAPAVNNRTVAQHRVAHNAPAPKTPMKRLNEHKGVLWLSKAAEQNNVAALTELGAYYESKQDFGQAVTQYQKAAHREYAEGQYKLGNCYYNGSGLERSNEKAADYYKRAARQGYAPAQFRLGNCYYHGEGIQQSDARAIDWFDQACDSGEKQACDMLKVAVAKK